MKQITFFKAEDFARAGRAKSGPTCVFHKGGSVTINKAGCEMMGIKHAQRIAIGMEGKDIYLQPAQAEGFEFRCKTKDTVTDGVLCQVKALVNDLTKKLDWPFNPDQKKSVAYTIIKLSSTDIFQLI